MARQFCFIILEFSGSPFCGNKGQFNKAPAILSSDSTALLLQTAVVLKTLFYGCFPWSAVPSVDETLILILKIGENKFLSYLSRMKQTIHFNRLPFCFN